MDLAIEAVEVCGLLLFVDHFVHMNGHHSVWVLFKDEQYYSINEVCAGEIIINILFNNLYCMETGSLDG